MPPKTDAPSEAPKTPEQRPTDPHTASVDEALNAASGREDDASLNVADQPPTTERMLRGHDADQEDTGKASELEIRELLTWDPYADEGEEHPGEKRAKSPAETPPEGRDETPQPGKPGEQAKGTEQEPKAPQSDELQQMRQALADAQRTIQQLMQQSTAPKPAPTQTAEQEEEAERNRLNGVYAYQIPDQLAEAIGSENLSERKMALAALFNSLGKETHFNALKDVREALQHLVGRIPEMVQGAVQKQSTQHDLAQDLYGAHPDLNKPAIRRLVPDIAQGVMRELGATQWSGQLRDAVARRVREELGLAQPQAAAAPAQAVVQNAGNGARPPAAFRSTVRANPSGFASRQQEDIMRTLGL